MKNSLIPMGKASAILTPKIIIKKNNIIHTTKLKSEKGCMLQPITDVRIGWDKSFKKMHKNGDDKLLIPEIFEDENFEECR